MKTLSDMAKDRGNTIDRIIEPFAVEAHGRRHEMAWMAVKAPTSELFYHLECNCGNSFSFCPRQAIRDWRRDEIRRELAARDRDRRLDGALVYLFGELAKHRFIGQEEGVECITADLLQAVTAIPAADMWPGLMQWLNNGRLVLDLGQGDRFRRGPAYSSSEY